MPDLSSTRTIDSILLHLRDGDRQAKARLMEHACERLRRLVSSHLRRDPQVGRWEDTGDVLQEVMLRMCRTLDEVEVKDSRHFFALASTQIRRQLTDLWRHYYGPEGHGAHHATAFAGSGEATRAPEHPVDRASSDRADPRQILELNELVERLPEELREVTDLLWYQGLSQQEAGEVLGVNVRTVGRRWREARLRLGQALMEETAGGA